MKLHYYPETDSLYVEFQARPGAETIEIIEGLNVDIDADGEVVGFDIDQASRTLGLVHAGNRSAAPSQHKGGMTTPAVIAAQSLEGDSGHVEGVARTDEGTAGQQSGDHLPGVAGGADGGCCRAVRVR